MSKLAVLGSAAIALALAACAGGAGAPGEDADTMGMTRAPVADPAIAPQQAAVQETVARGRPVGFLTPEITPDATDIIPPPPREGEARNDVDWALFRSTRALEGSDRWAMAEADNSYRPDYLLSAFSCAVGVELTPENSPALTSILVRATIDAGAAAAGAKDVYKRTRPYLHNAGNICIEKSDGLAASYDYPSGHASLGWTAAMVVAALAPDRSTPVLARGRAYGESRVVCGVHNMSAVEAARTNAASVFAALQGSEEFVAGMTKARADMAVARTSGKAPGAALCAKEANLVKPLAR